jgi:AcrR family transcriptional regulator
LKTPADAWNIAALERASSRERQLSIKRDALLTVAAEILNKKGFEGLSLSELASRVGVSKQALYHYASSKEDILYRCYMRALDAAERAYDLSEAKGGTGLERVLSFVRHSHDTVEATLDNMGALTPAHREEVSQRAKELEKRMRRFITRGMRDGSIANGTDAKFTEFWILGSLAWLPKWYDPKGEKPLNEVLDSFVDLISKGLMPR